MAQILRREMVLRDWFPTARLFNNNSTSFATSRKRRKEKKQKPNTIEKKNPSLLSILNSKPTPEKIPLWLPPKKSSTTKKSELKSVPTNKSSTTKTSERGVAKTLPQRSWNWGSGPDKDNLKDIVTFKRHTTLLLGTPRCPIKSGALRRNTGTQDQRTIEFLDMLSGLSGRSEEPLSCDGRDDMYFMGSTDNEFSDIAAFEEKNSLLFPQITGEVNLEFSPEYELVTNEELEQLMVSHHLKVEKCASTCYLQKSEFGLSTPVSVVSDIFVSEKTFRHSQIKHYLEIPYSEDVVKYKCADKLKLKQSVSQEKDKLELNISSKEISDAKYCLQPEDKHYAKKDSKSSEEYSLSSTEVNKIKDGNQCFNHFQTKYSQAPLSFKMISFFPLTPKENILKDDHNFESDAKKYFNYLPSVTGVIKKTMSERNKLMLEKWKENMTSILGEKGFELHQQETLRNGINLHENIREKLSGKPLKDIKIMSANKGHWDSFQPFLAEVQQVEGLEKEVSHQHLMYRGFFDCLATYKNEICLIDWKTSKKPKIKIQQTFDNPLQVAAYIGAWNSNLDNIKQNKEVTHGVIVVGYPDGSPADIHVMKPRDCEKYWSLWTKRLSNFYQTLYYEKIEHQAEEEKEQSSSQAFSSQSHKHENQDSEANLPQKEEEESSLSCPAQSHTCKNLYSEDSNFPQSFKEISGFPFISSTILDFEKSNKGFKKDFNKLFTSSPLVKDILDITWSEERNRKNKEKSEEAIEEFIVDSLNQELELHTAIQKLTYTPLEEINPPQTIENYWASIQHVLSDLSDIQGMEMNLFHNHLMYSADVNCIAQYRDKMCIIQWLPSRKPLPHLYDTGDAPLYVTAAMGALNSYPCYDHKFVLPTHGMVVVVYSDGSPAHVHSLLPEKHWVQWVHRLHTYFKIKHTKHTHHWR